MYWSKNINSNLLSVLVNDIQIKCYIEKELGLLLDINRNDLGMFMLDIEKNYNLKIDNLPEYDYFSYKITATCELSIFRETKVCLNVNFANIRENMFYFIKNKIIIEEMEKIFNIAYRKYKIKNIC